MRKTFIIALAVIILGVGLFCFYKPSIHSATPAQLHSVHGIRYDGVVFEGIIEHLINNPNAKVEDLRQINGVDNMIIDQLKERWR